MHVYPQRKIEQKHYQIEAVPLAVRPFLGMINDVIFWPRFLVMDLEITKAEVEHVVAIDKRMCQTPFLDIATVLFGRQRVGLAA
ncbi:MAG: hypothetical protein F6J95_000155 [Leptolyngbya sp. SIO1E4]|nr:hypothetical protein [Leptolyngbya sp. SIO1E4]